MALCILLVIVLIVCSIITRNFLFVPHCTYEPVSKAKFLITN